VAAYRPSPQPSRPPGRAERPSGRRGAGAFRTTTEMVHLEQDKRTPTAVVGAPSQGLVGRLVPTWRWNPG
jgi:hypothetical protein